MNDFKYRRASLFAEGVALSRIAREVGTPTYVYSRATLERHFWALDKAFARARHLVCYSVKASSNLSLLRLLFELGSGFDIVSQGELARVLKATSNGARKTVFSGVGKTATEMAAALEAGILMFNVESAEELAALDRVGRGLGLRAPFAIRVNPEVDPKTHRHIATSLRTSKFGVSFGEALRLYRKSRGMKGLIARGVDCHIGSQLTQMAPLSAAMARVAGLYAQLLGEGFALEYLDAGGGLGITYREERPPSVAQYANALLEPLRGIAATLLLEPGRVLVGNAGVLLTQVIYRKTARAKRLVVADAGMNDLIRPALYEAHHALLPVRRRSGRARLLDVVGPLCESSDVLARARRVPMPAQGELLAIGSAGAYGMSMASNYNGRPRAAEVLVDGTSYQVIRKRERVEDLWCGERG